MFRVFRRTLWQGGLVYRKEEKQRVEITLIFNREIQVPRASLLSIIKHIWQVFREGVLGKDIPSKFPAATITPNTIIEHYKTFLNL